ncbi:MAG: 50S ribosome-binding GTPase, partial [Oscillospiraceae bacterium]|nr:50S ribosome-binding GTPase [Oscillospiraceae bacterium]
MGLNDTPSGDRVHIGFFGRRNAGKSSVVNAVTGQALAVVSEVKGTTTDPVRKAMELLPLGPVMIIDTPGFDDEGELGALRVQKTRQVLNRTDIAVLVVDAQEGRRGSDEQLIRLFTEKEIPYLVVFNKADLLPGMPEPGENELYVSAKTGFGIHELKERMARMRTDGPERRLIGDLLSPNDLAVLVVPIDKAAPKGRLILPQQQ